MRLRQDAQLNRSKALPNGAAATSTDVIDLELSNRADFVAGTGMDLELVAPALTTAQLPDAQTLTYDIETDDNAAFSSPTKLYPGFISQVGAGGVGAVGQTKRCALPSNVERFVRATCTKTGASNPSALSYTLTPNF